MMKKIIFLKQQHNFRSLQIRRTLFTVLEQIWSEIHLLDFLSFEAAMSI